MLELLALSGLLWPFLIFVLIVAILWTILPFAIFGTKPILRELLRQQSETAKILLAQRGAPETHVLCPYCREPVRNDASKCKHCLSSLTPRPPPPPPEPKKGLLDAFRSKR